MEWFINFVEVISIQFILLLSVLVLGNFSNKTNSFFSSIYGIIYLFLFFGIISFFYPIEQINLFVLFIFLVLVFKNLLNKNLFRHKELIIIFTLISLVNSHYAFHEITWYDTYLYHLNQVKIIRDYGFVPGIALIHTRLGFNSILPSYFASLDLLFSNKAVYVGNLFLFNLVFSLLIFNLLKNKKLYNLILLAIFIVFSFFRLSGKDLPGYELPSYSTDLALNSFLFLYISLWINFISETSSYKFIGIVIGLFTLMSLFKLGGAFFVVSLGFFFLFINKFFEFIRKNYLFIILLSILILTQILRSAIATGWLYFPIDFGNLSLPWTIPENYVKLEIILTKAWAVKAVRGISLEYFLANKNFFQWFPKYFSENLYKNETILLIITFIIFPFFLIIKKSFLKLKQLCLITSFVVAYLLFLNSAPDYRFLSSMFYIFPFLFVLHLTNFKIKTVTTNISIVAIVLVPVFLHFKKFNSLDFKYKPLHTFELNLKKWRRGLILYKPTKGDQCGDSPIPCAPDYTTKLGILDYNSPFILSFRKSLTQIIQ